MALVNNPVMIKETEAWRRRGTYLDGRDTLPRTPRPMPRHSVKQQQINYPLKQKEKYGISQQSRYGNQSS